MSTSFTMSCIWLAMVLPTYMRPDKPASNGNHSNVDLTVRDFQRGFTFALHPDGRVELNITETKDGKSSEKSYKAASLDEFKREHPKIAEEYQIDRFTPRQFWDSTKMPLSAENWQSWKNWFDEDWFWDKGEPKEFVDQWSDGFHSEELNNWFEKQRHLFEEFRALPMPPVKGEQGSRENPHTLGIVVGEIGDALASQLKIDPQRGVLVLKVIPGSPAEKAGIKRNDIVLKLNGKELGGLEQFRADLGKMMTSAFTLDVLRKGQHETLNVTLVS